MKSIIIAIFTVLNINLLLGQEIFDNTDDRPEQFWSNSKELGLNFSPLVSTLIPFNLGNTEAGFTNLIYKRYGRKYAFRLAAGIEIDSDEDDGFILLTLGFEKRRKITNKITFTTGLDIGLFGEIDDEGGALMSTFYGFEYHFNQRFHMATEGNIQFLYSDEGTLNINPPVAVFFYVRI